MHSPNFLIRFPEVSKNLSPSTVNALNYILFRIMQYRTSLFDSDCLNDSANLSIYKRCYRASYFWWITLWILLTLTLYLGSEVKLIFGFVYSPDILEKLQPSKRKLNMPLSLSRPYDNTFNCACRSEPGSSVCCSDSFIFGRAPVSRAIVDQKRGLIISIDLHTTSPKIIVLPSLTWHIWHNWTIDIIWKLRFRIGTNYYDEE